VHQQWKRAARRATSFVSKAIRLRPKSPAQHQLAA